MRRKATPEELALLKARIAYQWNWKVAQALLPPGEEFKVDVVRGRIRYLLARDGKVYLTVRPNDGFLTPSLAAGERIRKCTDPPRFRIVIRGDREIRGSVLARDVVGVDPGLRAGDEVIVVAEDDSLVGVGRLRVPPLMMRGLVYGEVARLRSRVK